MRETINKSTNLVNSEQQMLYNSNTSNQGRDQRAVGNATTLRSDGGTQFIAKSKMAPKNLQLSFLNGNLDLSVGAPQSDTPINQYQTIQNA